MFGEIIIALYYKMITKKLLPYRLNLILLFHAQIIYIQIYRINDAVGNDGDIDLLSVGLTYRFGVTKEVAPVSEQKEAVRVYFYPHLICRRVFLKKISI